MARRLCIWFMLAIATCLAYGQDHEDWIVTVYELGGQATFNCSNYPLNPKPNVENNLDWTSNPPEGWQITGWMLPTLEIIDISYAGPTYEVMNDGWSLLISNVTREQFGVYHCMYNTTDDKAFLVKWGLNMKGPFFDDLWAKYERRTYIGLGSMFAFFLLCFGIYLVYINRWIPDETYLNSQEEEEEAVEKAKAALDTSSNKGNAGRKSNHQIKPTDPEDNIVHRGVAKRGHGTSHAYSNTVHMDEHDTRF